MELSKAIEVLKEHNEWRLGADIPMENPKVITEAINTVVNNFKYFDEKQERISDLECRVKELKNSCLEFSQKIEYTEKEKEDYWGIDCKCGFKGLSMFALGGGQIADTGDHSSCYCPVCCEVVD